MQDPENQTPTRNDFMQAFQRCAEAYHHVRAELPKGYPADLRNQQEASLAFIAQLPLLCDPASFQLYIACVSQGVGIGAVDICDAGRLCHLAQTAMSAWKLANLVVPAAQNKEKEAARKGEKKATPLPSKGNQSSVLDNVDLDRALQQALKSLPSFEEQKKYFLLLRGRGHLLPSDPELRDNPLAALHFCREAEQIIRDEALAGISPKPQPGQELASPPRKEPKQAA